MGTQHSRSRREERNDNQTNCKKRNCPLYNSTIPSGKYSRFNYCDKHREFVCLYNVGGSIICGRLKNDIHDHNCPKHKCRTKSCNNAKQSNNSGDYCSDCKAMRSKYCEVESCHKLAKRKYCEFHQCSRDSCVEKREEHIFYKNYCRKCFEIHVGTKCYEQGCFNIATTSYPPPLSPKRCQSCENKSQ